ncbi:imidazole glycerol phosphate synthase cyclase subunit [Alphaproteobacteria bacterium]|nr:imidazole glycerol phosphate synthase cyclase subunit [Alphaproteobacteria bacterium]
MRLIARLDIKWPNLIKGVQLEGLRIMGDPAEFAKRYYDQNIDEIIYMDVVASLYGRNSLIDLIKKVSKGIFVPMTVGGGIRSVEDARMILRSGADKIALNTAAIQRPKLISELATAFGSQCVVLSIEAKKQNSGKWMAYTDNGRERSEIDALEWAKVGAELGAGEILLTSVDKEGTQKGFDIELTKALSNLVNVPVIASGGMGNMNHIIELRAESGVDAVAMASVLHYDKVFIPTLRKFAKKNGLPVRD